MVLKDIYLKIIRKIFPDKSFTDKIALYNSINKLFSLENNLPTYLSIDITKMSIYDLVNLVSKYKKELNIHSFIADNYVHFIGTSGTVIFDKQTENIDIHKDKYVFRTRYMKFVKPTTFFNTVVFTDYLNLYGLNHILVADDTKIVIFTDYSTSVSLREIKNIRPFSNNQQFDILDISLINNKRMQPYVKITAHIKNRLVHYFYEIETFDLIYSKGIDEYGRVIYEGKIIPT